MLLPVHDALRDRLRAVLVERYGLDAHSLPAVVLEYPPNRALGDLGTPVAFELARRLRKAPRIIAQELADSLGAAGGVRVAAAPNGYLNFFLDRRAFLLERLTRRATRAEAAPGGKTIVEHTAINPNKAAHVGHLRNSALGDTLVRVLRFKGVPVEVQNYIDDTGVQVADVVVGFRVLEGKTLDEVRALADATIFDYYCWDLYARVTHWYEADAARLAARSEALHDIEHGGNESAALGAFIADRIVRRHLRTMRRLNIEYDLLTWEGDILRRQFWARAFEILKQSGAVFLQTKGKLAGCWVMRIDEAPLDAAEGGDAAPDLESPDSAGEDAREKVIVRSNGIVTYVGKDIAYQFWKFGLLGRDFHYRVFDTRPDGGTLWATSSDPTPEEAKAPRFGHADRTYNVIDDRQAYLQKLLQQALVTLGYPQQAERSIHFSYGMVALSHATARELGYVDEAEANAKRGFIEVSGRKGRGVKADDLIDRLIARAGEEVTARNPELSEEDRRRTAETIAVAAVRYSLIKYSRTKVIAFDIAEALNFEGESGPYLQYAVVRANNIFNKLRDRDGVTEGAVIAALPDTPSSELDGADGSHDLWALALDAARLDEIVEQVVRTLEFSVLAKFAFGLAQAFNAFYHRYPILNEERADVRRWRAAAVAYVRAQLTQALDLMGIAVPSRM